MTLQELPIGHIALIASVGDQRLESMGIQVGKSVTVLRRNPGGTVLHCRIGSVEYAIRQDVAQNIKVIQ